MYAYFLGATKNLPQHWTKQMTLGDDPWKLSQRNGEFYIYMSQTNTTWSTLGFWNWVVYWGEKYSLIHGFSLFVCTLYGTYVFLSLTAIPEMHSALLGNAHCTF